MTVNSAVLGSAYNHSDMRHHGRKMTEEGLKEVLRQWLEDLVHEKASGNENQFARDTKLHEPDVNKAINRKGRAVSLAWLVKIGQAEGYPPLNEIFAALAERIAIASTKEIHRTQREKLRARLASGELQARASSAARSRRQGERPGRPIPPGEAHAPKTDDQD